MIVPNILYIYERSVILGLDNFSHLYERAVVFVIVFNIMFGHVRSVLLASYSGVDDSS